MNRIRRARIIAGLTQGELAARIGVSPVAISKWENQLSHPRPKRLKQLSETLQISVEDLLMEDGA